MIQKCGALKLDINPGDNQEYLNSDNKALTDKYIKDICSLSTWSEIVK